MNEDSKFALVPRAPSALEKTEPGAKRFLSGIVTDTLALAKRHSPEKRIFSLLTCGGEAFLSASIKVTIGWYSGRNYDVSVVDRWQSEEILALMEQQRFDIIVPLVNNMSIRGSRLWSDKVEFFRRLKGKYRIPIIALFGYKPIDFDPVKPLTDAGVDAFLYTPFMLDEFHSALDYALKNGGKHGSLTGERD